MSFRGARWRERALVAAAVVPVALAAGSVSAQAATPPSPQAGSYSGTITDANGEPDTYTATIRLTATTLRTGRRAGTVRYSAAYNGTTFAPALACQGTLAFLGRANNHFSFRETIAGGAAAQCISGGTVTLTRLGNRALTYTWTKRGFSDPSPTGRLTRNGK